MPRLDTEFCRLYAPTPHAIDADHALIDTQGRVRALVLELARTADWSALSLVWQGVQADFGWPAPGIAVSGVDGMQLWFSLAEPVSVAQGHAALQALRLRYLADVAPARMRLMPTAGDDQGLALQGLQVPALHPATGNWSAFIAPDLAPLFVDTPWLDVPPGDEAQASLLARLGSIDAASFREAQETWQRQAALVTRPPSELATRVSRAVVEAAVAAPVMQRRASSAIPGEADMGEAISEPVRFLLSVMNDASVPLPLRIDAAKALLPYTAAPSA